MKLLVGLATLAIAAATAHANYYIAVDCPDGSHFETELATPDHDACLAQIPAYQVDHPSCALTCEYESGQTSSGGGGGGRLIRTYGVGRRGWPYGRSAILVDVMPLGLGAASGGARFAVGPGTATLRVLPRISVGGFFGFLFPGDVSAYGGQLRFALKANDLGSDHGGYYELYVESGAGVASTAGGTGQLYTASLGISLITGYMFGFGLSTRFSYGSVEGPVDVDVQSWDVIMAHVLVVGL